MTRVVMTLAALLLSCSSCASERNEQQHDDDAGVVVTTVVDAGVHDDARVAEDEPEPAPSFDAGAAGSVPPAPLAGQGAAGSAGTSASAAGASGGAAGAAGAVAAGASGGAAGSAGSAAGAPAPARPARFCQLPTARLGCDAESRKLYPRLMLSWVFDGHVRVCGDGSNTTLYPCPVGGQCQAYNYDTKKSTAGSCL